MFFIRTEISTRSKVRVPFQTSSKNYLSDLGYQNVSSIKRWNDNVDHILIKWKINIKLPGKQNKIIETNACENVKGLFAETQRLWLLWLRSERFSFSKDLRCFHYPRKANSHKQAVCPRVCLLFTSIKLALCKFIWMHNAFFVCADNDFTLRFLHRLAVTATLNIFSLLDTVKNDRREDVPTRADVADQCKYILENKRSLRNLRSLIQWKNFKIPAAQVYPNKFYNTYPQMSYSNCINRHFKFRCWYF